MSDSAWKDDSDQVSSNWLDTDGEPSSGAREHSLDKRAETYVADLQLVDALLGSLWAGNADQRETRIGRVMQAVETPTPQATNHRATNHRATNRRRWQTGVAIAASLLISFGLLWLQASKETRASELLREMGRVSLEPQDRRYTIRHTDTRAGGQPDREGSLYLRGCDGFVVVCGDVILGRNADEYWFVPSSGSVVVAENFNWIVGASVQQQRELELLKEISVESRRAPLVQLSAVVEMMQHDYDVTLGTSDAQDGPSADVLTGRRRQHATLDLPDTIRLWTRADSRIIHRAELSWGVSGSAMNRTVLELNDSGPVPADWYDHERHHLSERSVRHVSSGL